jgi:hypothetical protein
VIFLPAAQRAAKPWKNGGGVTREVAAFPPGSGLDRFDWRVSIADVAEDGPFSIFPGIERTLTILSGDGIALDIAGRETRLRPGEDPFSFPADQPADCRLLGGPVVDLNVMSRRGAIAHKVVPITRPQTLPVAEGVLVWIRGTGRIGAFEMGEFDAIEAQSPGDWTIQGNNFLAYHAAFTRL